MHLPPQPNRRKSNAATALPVLCMSCKQPSISMIKLSIAPRSNGAMKVERTASNTLRADCGVLVHAEPLAALARARTTRKQLVERLGGVRKVVGVAFEQREELLFFRQQSSDPAHACLLENKFIRTAHSRALCLL